MIQAPKNPVGPPAASPAAVPKRAQIPSSRIAWRLLFALAVIVRMVAMVREPAYLHPDATWQAIEPAHHLLHGPLAHSALPWEFQQGLRSWMWPMVIALPMWLGEQLSSLAGVTDIPAWSANRSALGIYSVRTLCIAIDMLTLWGLRCATITSWSFQAIREPKSGAAALRAAWWACLVFVFHPIFSIPGSQPLIDIPAAAALTWLLVASLRAASAPTTMNLAGVGAMMAAAVVIRVQLAPSVLTAALMLGLHYTRSAPDLRPTPKMIGGAIAGACTFLALTAAVDAWGPASDVPLAWWWRYLEFNFHQGTHAFGTMPRSRYLEHAILVCGPVPLLITCVLVGIAGRRARWLVVAASAFFLFHQLLPYRVWRFIHPGLPLVCGVIGIGYVRLLQWIRPRSPRLARSSPLLFAAGLALSSAEAWSSGSLWQTTWLYNQGGAKAVSSSRELNMALLWCAGDHETKRVVQWLLPGAASPGQAFVGHDIPVLSPLGRPELAPVPRSGDRWIVPSTQAVAAGGMGMTVVHKTQDVAIFAVLPRRAPK